LSDLTPAVARALTRDWATEFPAFAVWRPLRLLRRLGPWVQGITLERSSAGDDYRPTAHVHALTRDFPVISLTLASPLRTRGVGLRPSGSATMRSPMWTRLGGWPAAATFRWTGRRPWPNCWTPTGPSSWPTGPATCRRPVFRRPMSQRPMSSSDDLVCGPAVLALDEPTHVSAYDGVDLAATVRESLELAAAEAARWRSGPPGYATSGDWVEHLRARASDPVALADCVTRQVAAHKLSNLPRAWN